MMLFRSFVACWVVLACLLVATCGAAAVTAPAGTPLWTIQAPGGVVSAATIGYDGSTVFICSGGNTTLPGVVSALNSSTGETIFQLYFPHQCGNSPLVIVHPDLLVVGTFAGYNRPAQLAAFDARTGASRWSRSWFCSIHGSPAASDDGSLIFFGCDDTIFRAVRSSTGATAWEFDTSYSGRTTAVVTKETLYMTTDGGDLYALNARTGKRLWKRTFTWAPQSYTSTPVLGGVWVFVAGVMSNLTAFEAATGRVSWDIANPEVGGPYTTVAYDGGRVFAGDNRGYCWCLHAASGHVLWSFNETNQSQILAPPAVVPGGNVVLFATVQSSQVIALNAQSGSVLWRYQGTNIYYAQPAILPLNDRISTHRIAIVADADGSVAALQL